MIQQIVKSTISFFHNFLSKQYNFKELDRKECNMLHFKDILKININMVLTDAICKVKVKISLVISANNFHKIYVKWVWKWTVMNLLSNIFIYAS